MTEGENQSSIGARLTDHLSIGVLTKTVPRYIVDEVLIDTKRTEQRRRSLPAHVVVYFVMALALFRDGYEEVMAALSHGMRFTRTWSREWQLPSRSALCQARARLGEEPLRELFTRLAVPIATESTPGAYLGNRRLLAIDGVMLDIPDTPENTVEYPKPDGGTRRPYPQVRIVALGECGTQATLAAAIGSLNIGERDLAAQLRAEVGPNTLVIADRGFYSFPLWRDYQSTGADLLWRLSATMKLPVHQVLPDGSYLSEIKKKSGPGKTWIPLHLVVDTPELATHIQVRVIEFSTDSDGPNENYRLITTITDPTDLNATELAHAYLQRWELETAFRQIECQLLEPSGTLRSKTPPMIRQEIWALLLTHYAIRAFITDAADTIDIDPDRISTIRAINIVRRSVTDAAALSPLTPGTPPPHRYP